MDGGSCAVAMTLEEPAKRTGSISPPRPSETQTAGPGMTVELSRRRFLCSTAAGAAWLLACPDRSDGAHALQPFHVGAGCAEITPPLEVGILMSSGRQLWEPFDKVRLPLYARAVVVERAGRRIALVALDLLGLAGEAVGGIERFKARVAAAAGCGIGAHELVLASTHTHCGPESIALTDLYHTEAFKAWVGHLARQIGSAVRSASADQRSCQLMVGSHVAPGMALNRRIKTTRGIASVRRQLPPEVVIGPEGPIDDHVRVAAFLDQADRMVAILVNFAAHPVLEMCIKHVSPDYPGEMVLELQRRHPDAAVLFLQGACGNINPPNMERSPASARQYGQRLADRVDQALGELRPAGADGLRLCWKTIQLPLRTLAGEMAEQPLDTKIGAARIGNAAWVFLPGEPFVEIALAIRSASPWKPTTVVGYANDYIGYIPTDRAFENGGYEVRPGRWSRVAAGSEGIVCRAAIELLRTL